MKRLKFECRLMSDVILNQSAATEGECSTLDFIPGNCFLGIVAARYNDFGNDAITVFHSGRVRFGDAHPVCVGHEGVRSLRVPASIYYPKLKNIGESYVHHCYERNKDTGDNGSPQQLKQCRNGFYAFENNDKKAYPVNTDKSFAVKSAYDRESRRAKDSRMYCYESLGKGASFLFEVEVDDDRLSGKIRDLLVGKRHIGRSRSAQYGLVEIFEKDYGDVPSTNKLTETGGGKYVTVYADSRLIFLDQNNEPTFRPSAKDLGIDNGKICWDKSQVRTFRYAPWNGCRSTRDADRCGIEKGSVFVVENCGQKEFESQYVGAYRNEGFGKVVYNPSFLESKGENGRTEYHFEEPAGQKNDCEPSIQAKDLGGTPLLDYISRKATEDDTDRIVFKKVNEFVEQNKGLFSGDKFASQWGTIRTIAMRHPEDLEKAVIGKYVEKGVAKEKWEGGRKKILEEFISGMGGDAAKALINLASEMAKIAKNKRAQ